jgi:hypothetical protein
MGECGQIRMMPMDQGSAGPPLQDPQLALEHPSIGELEEDDPEDYARR